MLCVVSFLACKQNLSRLIPQLVSSASNSKCVGCYQRTLLVYISFPLSVPKEVINEGNYWTEEFKISANMCLVCRSLMPSVCCVM